MIICRTSLTLLAAGAVLAASPSPPAQVEKIAGNLRKPHLLKKVWDYHHAKMRRL